MVEPDLAVGIGFAQMGRIAHPASHQSPHRMGNLPITPRQFPNIPGNRNPCSSAQSRAMS